ncbi:hypothetical protein [Lactobacillus kalixensis]|uniref:Uncharacterized protein n=1 Tax=Lactobacillus kalixensis DSM 16043 TaxID=1423763 RepID=A0A0R1UGU3_9LACO|nr:hypothetical protein [Lactobacillus kalixensis]KRL89842.1 hypothetical protein FC46_GL000490 [Lactobacillus kalixensis DSM 16043]
MSVKKLIFVGDEFTSSKILADHFFDFSLIGKKIQTRDYTIYYSSGAGGTTSWLSKLSNVSTKPYDTDTLPNTLSQTATLHSLTLCQGEFYIFLSGYWLGSSNGYNSTDNVLVKASDVMKHEFGG